MAVGDRETIVLALSDGAAAGRARDLTAIDAGSANPHLQLGSASRSAAMLAATRPAASWTPSRARWA